MCYSLMALAHLSGPHRPDGFYGFSLMLMIAALLMRFGERLAEHWSWGTQPRPTSSPTRPATAFRWKI